MATQYEVITDDTGEVIKRITDDGIISWIPKDQSNSDYQAYLNKDNPTSGTIS